MPTQEMVISGKIFTCRITDDGREVVIRVHDDIRPSEHNRILQRLVEQKLDQGITRINCDHVRDERLDRSLSIWRGKRKVDITYEYNGQIRDVEVKTTWEIGQERTWRQLREMVRFSQHLTLAVPISEIINTQNILRGLGLEAQIIVEGYEEQD